MSGRVGWPWVGLWENSIFISWYGFRVAARSPALPNLTANYIPTPLTSSAGWSLKRPLSPSDESVFGNADDVSSLWSFGRREFRVQDLLPWNCDHVVSIVFCWEDSQIGEFEDCSNEGWRQLSKSIRTHLQLSPFSYCILPDGKFVEQSFSPPARWRLKVHSLRWNRLKLNYQISCCYNRWSRVVPIPAYLSRLTLPLLHRMLNHPPSLPP